MQTDDAHKFADQIGIELYETSAKENINVEEVRGPATTCRENSCACQECQSIAGFFLPPSFSSSLSHPLLSIHFFPTLSLLVSCSSSPSSLSLLFPFYPFFLLPLSTPSLSLLSSITLPLLHSHSSSRCFMQSHGLFCKQRERVRKSQGPRVKRLRSGRELVRKEKQNAAENSLLDIAQKI